MIPIGRLSIMPPTDPIIDSAVQAHLAQNNARISKISVNGTDIWIKRNVPERLRRRLSKGDTAKAFEAERKALHVLGAAGAAVPPILSEGPDYFAIPDCGPTLHSMLRHAESGDPAREAIFAKAAGALAQLHERGFSHGRPAIRDISHKEGVITFLDLERFAEKRNTCKGHRNDLITFIHSIYACRGIETPEALAAIKAYKAADKSGVWPDAQAFCRRLGFLVPMTKPLQRKSGKKSFEFKAIDLTLNAFK